MVRPRRIENVTRKINIPWIDIKITRKDVKIIGPPRLQTMPMLIASVVAITTVVLSKKFGG